MVRNRKIPARKHHGVRDPLKQLEDREKKLKDVINNPPQKNDQKESFKFTQFKKLADAAMSGKKIKKIHSGREDKPRQSKSNSGANTETTPNKFKAIKQFADEDDRNYLRRVNRITAESLREAQYEAKYGVSVVRDQKTGAITVKKRPKNEIDELLKQKLKEKRTGKLGKKVNKAQNATPMDPKMARELVKQAIKEEKEEAKQETKEEYQRDVIKFGEIVHAPPVLTTLPRKAAKNETVPRPGKKNNLLLKSLYATNVSKTATKEKIVPKTKTGKVTKVQLKGKRRDLPAGTRAMLENEQTKFIELYRNLKKAKTNQNS